MISKAFEHAIMDRGRKRIPDEVAVEASSVIRNEYMSNKWLRLGTVSIYFALSLWAAELTARWKLPFTDAEGKERESVFTFTVSGEHITGTLVQNGKSRTVEQDQYGGGIVFFTIQPFQGVSHYKEHLQGNHIAFDVWREGDSQRYHPIANRL